MNLNNLNSVFANYIKKFKWLNEARECDERYKWFAVKEFQETLDLDAADEEFASMLLRAKKATKNLIDSSQQPFGALCAYAKEEPAAVRAMLRQLFADDGGDLARRQEKIDVFLFRAEELRKKYAPTSHLFVNTQQSAMAYLWFYDPNTYYYYKATEAKYLADCVEFYDDWGTYNNFHLDVYHRFCDGIIAHMENCAALIDAHKSRFEGHKGEMYADERLHILLADVIFCAMRYGLYDGIPIKDTSAAAKRLYQERRAKAAELLAAVEAVEQSAALLEEAKGAFPDLVRSGAAITHRTFGKARSVELSGKYVLLSFRAEDEQKRFELLPSLAGGLIRLDTPDFDALLETYRAVMQAERNIPNRLATAQKALAPYQEYLD